MYRVHAEALIAALNNITTMEEIARVDPGWLMKDATRRSFMADQTAKLIAELENLNLRFSKKKAELLKQYITEATDYLPEAVAANIKTVLAELKSRIEHELEERVVYCLSSREAELAEQNGSPFGDEVGSKFQAANFDLEEARKCLVFSRGTACVFHLMRAMEAAVQRLSAVLKIERVEREWGKLLSDIRPKVEAMPAGKERNEWSHAHALLYHVKQAWRNDTMHPNEKYTEEEAREAYDAVRLFMRQLATLV